MSKETAGWLDVDRADITQLIESKIDFSSWKGDAHTKGVYFMDSHGFILNKVLAVRIRHQSSTDLKLENDLFYSFNAIESLSEDDTLSERYPFQDMKVKPKKHYLLFDTEKIEKPEISKLFDGPFIYGKVRVKPQPIVNLLDEISNKRDRERSAASINVQNGKLVVSISKSPSRRNNKVLASESLNCEVLEEPENGDSIQATVNAHTLMYLLGIFYPFPYVVFSFGRDRIMITGESGNQSPDVEVVISRLKTA